MNGLAKSLLHGKLGLSLLILRKITVKNGHNGFINGSKPRRLGFETPGGRYCSAQIAFVLDVPSYVRKFRFSVLRTFRFPSYVRSVFPYYVISVFISAELTSPLHCTGQRLLNTAHRLKC